MQSSISVEQEIVEAIRLLPLDKQQEVLDFVEFLRQKLATEIPTNNLSLQEIARLPIKERHQLLKNQISALADDFESDPALTEFSDLDMGSWDAAHVES